MRSAGQPATAPRKNDSHARAPELFRRYDPDLFDLLAKAVTSGRRDTAVLEEAGLFRDVVFHRAPVPEAAGARREYFNDLWRLAEGRRVTFFDPDNGFEVPSVPYGRRGAARYLYWHEFVDAWRRGFSLIVYQHYGRVPRIPFVDGLLERIGERVPAAPFALMTSRVAFFIIPQPVDAPVLEGAGRSVADAWAGTITFRPRDGSPAVPVPFQPPGRGSRPEAG
jgi:hypothetical protein